VTCNIGAALVESNLTVTYFIKNEPVKSNLCVRIKKSVQVELLLELIPPLYVTVEPWALQTSKALNRGENGSIHPLVLALSPTTMCKKRTCILPYVI